MKHLLTHLPLKPLAGAANADAENQLLSLFKQMGLHE